MVVVAGVLVVDVARAAGKARVAAEEVAAVVVEEEAEAGEAHVAAGAAPTVAEEDVEEVQAPPRLKEVVDLRKSESTLASRPPNPIWLILSGSRFLRLRSKND